MTNPVEQTKNIIDNLIEYIEQSPWRSEYLDKLKILKLEIDQPCVLAVAGRVKAGKSSFINALLGSDLAKVGTTETTATINIFKYGVPEDPNKPVCCVWSNRHKTWETKQFLDDMQGTDLEVLKRAKSISHFEYYLPDPKLKDITIVDTPGTSALTGDNDNDHQNTTEDYFNLRKKHTEETIKHTADADAVIYLVGEVAVEDNQNFLKQFQYATNGNSSAMNAIGVMSRIDLSDTIIEKRYELAANVANKLQYELNTVVPVSAGIGRALDILRKDNKIAQLQSQLKSIPDVAFEKMLSSETTYLRESSMLAKVFKLNSDKDLPDLPTRIAMRGNMPFRVFVVIANHLYRYELNHAIQKLEEISGMNQLKTLLDSHFFNRGKLLRCFRTVNQLNSIIREIERNKLYELRKESGLKSQFESFIQTHPKYHENKSLGNHLMELINLHLKNEKQIQDLENRLLNDLLPQIEELKLQLLETDRKFNALQLIENNNQLFTELEQTELYSLFGMYHKVENIPDEKKALRQQFWNLEFRLSQNDVRRKVAQVAIDFYGK